MKAQSLSAVAILAAIVLGGGSAWIANTYQASPDTVAITGILVGGSAWFVIRYLV